MTKDIFSNKLTVFYSGLLMRPEKDEAKAEARKCEAEAEAETKNFLWGRGQNIWGRGRGHSVEWIMQHINTYY